MRLNRIFVVSLALSTGAVWAQSYVGALVALTDLGVSCSSGARCDGRGNGFRIFAGTKLEKPIMQLGPVGVNVVEVGAMRFGKATAEGETQVTVNGVSSPVVQTVPVKTTVSANALTFALGSSMSVAQGFTVTPKVGFAYVSGSYKVNLDGVSQGGETKSSLQPYLGISAAYEAAPGVSVNAGLDWTRVRVESLGTGSAVQLGLGASLAF